MDFFIRYKKIFAVAGFILIVLVFGYLLYVVFFKRGVEPGAIITPPESATTTPSTGLPISPTGTDQAVPPTDLVDGDGKPALPVSPIANGGLTNTIQLNQVDSTSAILADNGSDLQYYNKNDGKFYRITEDGRITALSDKIFHQVDKIVWSPQKNKAILEYPDGANIIYNFSTDRQTTLPTHWEDFDFSQNGQQIITKSIGLDPNNRWLAVVNEDGSNSRRIEELGENKDIVYPSWSPNNQTIAMYTKGVGFDRQEVFFIGLNKENFKSMVVEGRGFQPKWSPAGDRLLYSVYSSNNNLKPNLWIDNAQGENIGSGRKNLNVETWANKCAFTDDSAVYCAVPEKLEEGAGLFPELADNTKDNLYKINTKTGLKKLVAVPNGDYNMSSIIISKNGQYLYFTDKISGRLHKIQLK